MRTCRTMLRLRPWGIVAGFVALLVLPGEVKAVQSWDLQADWSNATKAPGPWSYRALDGTLFGTFQSNTSASTVWNSVASDGSRPNLWTDSASPSGAAGLSASSGWTDSTMNWPMNASSGVTYDLRWTSMTDSVAFKQQ